MCIWLYVWYIFSSIFVLAADEEMMPSFTYIGSPRGYNDRLTELYLDRPDPWGDIIEKVFCRLICRGTVTVLSVSRRFVMNWRAITRQINAHWNAWEFRWESNNKRAPQARLLCVTLLVDDTVTFLAHQGVQQAPVIRNRHFGGGTMAQLVMLTAHIFGFGPPMGYKTIWRT